MQNAKYAKYALCSIILHIYFAYRAHYPAYFFSYNFVDCAYYIMQYAKYAKYEPCIIQVISSLHTSIHLES